MGLKTTNYKSKALGFEFPEAYAVLRTLIIEADDTINATFVVQLNREATLNYQSFDRVKVATKWDRQTDPVKMAYEAAKTDIKEIPEYDESTGQMVIRVKYGTLYGWEDDIVIVE